jgi:hypothetical protein
MNDAFTTNGTRTSSSRSTRTIAVDNLLRKALRVSDPRDPSQIASALLMRYPQEADRQRREQAGLPYSSIPEQAVGTAISGVASSELIQARDDLERDLLTLTTSSELKDLRVELVGWGRAVRQLAADGLAAARLALDASNHDRAMAARRSLSEYARLARYVGALSDGSSIPFRRLAQSCDVLAGLILVAIGDGLAANGVTRSTSLTRVAAGELQARRNAVITALRSLTGSVEASLDQEGWPRGLEAYRNLIRKLDESGQSDLRALLEENALGAAMDELVDLSTGASIEGLRELSTASSMLIHRFKRLIQYGQPTKVPLATPISNTSPESPPLITFMSALQLFVDAFEMSGSTRLLYVSRPPILVYGLYGVGGPDEGAKRLIELTLVRGFMLEQIDCFSGCACDDSTVACQILLDFLLFKLDRAIDAYAVGSDPGATGEPERRCAATGKLILDALSIPGPGRIGSRLCNFGDGLKQSLTAVGDALCAATDGDVPADASHPLLIRELQTAYQEELQTERLVRSLSPSCHVANLFGQGEGKSLICRRIRALLQQLGADVAAASTIPIPNPIASILASRFQGRADYSSDV